MIVVGGVTHIRFITIVEGRSKREGKQFAVVIERNF
jgi:hypothetical protein